MQFEKTDFEGLFVITPKLYGDNRGWFTRTFSFDIFKEKISNFDSTWVQMNHSYSEKKGTWRGFHYQDKPFQETKLVRFISGEVIDFVIDLRKESNTFLKTFKIELSKENQKMLYIPKGFAHGFFTIEDDSELIYLHDEYYNSEFEQGIRFNDPLISIDIKPLIISERDKNHNLLPPNFKGI